MASLAFKGAKALSALAVGPVGLLAPFVSLGAHKKHPCDVKEIVKKLGNKVHWRFFAEFLLPVPCVDTGSLLALPVPGLVPGSLSKGSKGSE